MIALALSTQQPLYTEILAHWTDRDIATAWELLRDTEKELSKGTGRARGRPPGAGGPQYSG